MFTFAVLICGVRGISPGNAVFSLEPRVVDSESITQPATRGHMVDRAVWAAVEHAAADSGATDPAEKAETAAEPGYEGPVYLWQFSKPKSPPPPGYTYDGSPPVPQEDNILPPRVDTVPVAVQDVVEDLKDKVKNGPVDVGNEVEMLDKVTNHAIKQDAAKEKPGAAPEKAPSDAAESQVKMKATDNVTPDFKPLAMDTLSRGVKKLRQFGKNLGLRMIPPIDPVGLGLKLATVAGLGLALTNTEGMTLSQWQRSTQTPMITYRLRKVPKHDYLPAFAISAEEKLKERVSGEEERAHKLGLLAQQLRAQVRGLQIEAKKPLEDFLSDKKRNIASEAKQELLDVMTPSVFRKNHYKEFAAMKKNDKLFEDPQASIGYHWSNLWKTTKPLKASPPHPFARTPFEQQEERKPTGKLERMMRSQMEPQEAEVPY